MWAGGNLQPQSKASVTTLDYRLPQLPLVLQGDSDDKSEDPDMKAAKLYFSGDDDVGWRQGQNSKAQPPVPEPEGVSSSTIVSGLVASRKQDHAVSCYPDVTC